MTQIENEIAILENQLREKLKAAALEKSEGIGSGVIPSEREVFKEVIKDKINEEVSAIQEPLKEHSGIIKPPTSSEKPSYLSKDIEDKVKELVNLVIKTKSLSKGIRAAQNSNNPAVIDGFHDIIADELYSRFIEDETLERVQ